MRTRKPEAGRGPYEDASAAALRSLRGHLELDEVGTPAGRPHVSHAFGLGAWIAA